MRCIATLPVVLASIAAAPVHAEDVRGLIGFELYEQAVTCRAGGCTDGEGRPAHPAEILQAPAVISVERSRYRPIGVWVQAALPRASGATAVLVLDLARGQPPIASYEEWSAGARVFDGRAAGGEVLLGPVGDLQRGSFVLRFLDPGADGTPGTSDDAVRVLARGWFVLAARSDPPPPPPGDDGGFFGDILLEDLLPVGDGTTTADEGGLGDDSGGCGGTDDSAAGGGGCGGDTSEDGSGCGDGTSDGTSDGSGCGGASDGSGGCGGDVGASGCGGEAARAPSATKSRPRRAGAAAPLAPVYVVGILGVLRRRRQGLHRCDKHARTTLTGCA